MIQKFASMPFGEVVSIQIRTSAFIPIGHCLRWAIVAAGEFLFGCNSTPRSVSEELEVGLSTK